jgi:hypothetical protein
VKLLTLFVCLFLSTAAFAAGGKNINIRYNLASGLIFDVNLGPYMNLGAVYNSAKAEASASSIGSIQKTTVTGTTYGGRLTFNLQGQGMDDGFYLAAEGGSLSLTAKRTQTGVEDYSGEKTGTYYGAFLGYHWFWGVFNLNLGAGTLNWNIDSLTLKNSTASETYTNLPKGASGLELGIGLAF